MWGEQGRGGQRGKLMEARRCESAQPQHSHRMEPSAAQAIPPVPAGPGLGPSSFEADPRVHFNTVSGKWTFEADNGSELEWEVGRGVWVPVVSSSELMHRCA